MEVKSEEFKIVPMPPDASKDSMFKGSEKKLALILVVMVIIVAAYAFLGMRSSEGIFTRLESGRPGDESGIIWNLLFFFICTLIGFTGILILFCVARFVLQTHRATAENAPKEPTETKNADTNKRMRGMKWMDVHSKFERDHMRCLICKKLSVFDMFAVLHEPRFAQEDCEDDVMMQKLEDGGLEITPSESEVHLLECNVEKF